LTTLQRDVSKSLGVSPKTWGLPKPARDVTDVMLWLADYGGASAPRAIRQAAELYVGGTKLAKPPTPYENPKWYALTASLCKEICQVARARHLKLPRELLFGTLPIGSMNAFALKTEAVTITLYQVGVFNFLNSVCKLVCLACPLEEEAKFVGDGRGWRPPSLRYARGRSRGQHTGGRFLLDMDSVSRHIKNNFETIRALFVDIFSKYFLDGDVLKGRRFLLSPRRQQFNGVLLHSAELFVVGHEHGHIIHGDLDDPKTRRAALAGQEVTEALVHWDQEFEADVVGLDLAMEVMRRRKWADFPVSSLGVGVFFAAADILERLAYGFASGNFRSDDGREPDRSLSHPPALVRLSMLQEALTDSARSAGRPDAENVANLFQLPFYILHSLHLASAAQWMQMYKTGRQPARNLGF
jgi:hypothetical protein